MSKCNGKLPKKRGAKPLWDTLEIDRRLPQIEKWYQDGLTDKDVAHNLRISHTTLNKWKKENVAFLASLKRGKSLADERVVNALYQRAIGYEKEEDVIFQYQGKPVVVRTIKYHPPDATSMIFWLKNRQPDKWRDKQEIEMDIRKQIEEEFDGRPWDLIEEAKKILIEASGGSS